MVRSLLLLTISAWAFCQLNAQTIQRVIIEEHTGAWCGYCPDGALILEDVLDNNPNAIGVSIHQGDAMNISVNSLIRSFYGPAYPQATINRLAAPISRAQWPSATASALQGNPIVSVSFDSVDYQVGTRVLYARLKATFHRDTTGTLRFNMYVTEDGVTGTGSGYNQVNYYNGTAGSPLQGLGDPIIGYVHNHVLRYSAGSAWGTPNSIPTTVTANQEVTWEYTVTLPSIINDINNAHLVIMVSAFGGQQPHQRPQLNSDEMPLAMAVGLERGLGAQSNLMHIYPNPSSHLVNVSFTVAEMGEIRLEAYNMAGQRVAVIAQGITNSGTHTVTWDAQDASGNRVPNGMYLIRMVSESGQSMTKRVMIQSN